MTKRATNKQALYLSLFAILMCILLLVGNTFAWFTDTVTSSGNKIESGNFVVDLELLNKDGSWSSLKQDKNALFNNDKWEPGYTDVKILRIENEGDLNLKWMAKFVSEDALSILADAIDVYVLNYGVLEDDATVTYPADRTLNGYTQVGTLAEFINSIEETTKGTLKAGEKAYLGIALKMRESAGNEYQGLSLGGIFDIKIVASQATGESDGFDDQYDVNAPLNFAPVANARELKAALQNQEENILFTANFPVEEKIVVDYDVNIDGAGFALMRQTPATTFSARTTTTAHLAEVFSVEAGATLTLENIVVDGGAIWSGEIDAVLNRGMENTGLTATGALVVLNANSHLILGEGAVLQNNDGAHAVNMGTRIGATLTLEGGHIINNNSGSGAIYGGGHITLNAGSIRYNSSTASAGAIRMVSSCNFTVNGGEISYNKATTAGGVIWGYGASVYNFNGGKIYGNSASVGGVLYTGDGSTVNVGGNVEIFENVATESCGAFRISNYTKFNMSGGKIYGNVSATEERWTGFYGWNPNVNISGGQLDDNIFIQGGLTPTIGGEGIRGIVYFDLGTGHNTANLGASFGAFKFYVTEGENFSAFNLKPVTGYTYTEGDETKLICQNEGYETYWDAQAGVFKIQAQ